jgi:FAD/FMN-containing dehydrogenase
VTASGRIQAIEHRSQRALERPDQLYGGDAYGRLKARYDPDGRFPDLFDMAVRSVSVHPG